MKSKPTRSQSKAKREPPTPSKDIEPDEGKED
jgi:hypothetical protein